MTREDLKVTAEKALHATKEATEHAAEVTKEYAEHALDATKEATDKALDATKVATGKAVDYTKENPKKVAAGAAVTAGVVASALAALHIRKRVKNNKKQK